MQRKKLLADPFFDAAKVRVRMARTFLDSWAVIRSSERSLKLPIVIHYSPIDQVPLGTPLWRHFGDLVIGPLTGMQSSIHEGLPKI